MDCRRDLQILKRGSFMKISLLSAVAIGCVCFAAYGGDKVTYQTTTGPRPVGVQQPVNTTPNTTTPDTTTTTTTTRQRSHQKSTPKPAAPSYPTDPQDIIALKQGDSLPTHTIFPNIAGRPARNDSMNTLWNRISLTGEAAKIKVTGGNSNRRNNVNE